MRGVRRPGVNPCIDGIPVDASSGVRANHSPQAPFEPLHVRVRQRSFAVSVQDVAKKFGGLARRQNNCLSRMEKVPTLREECANAPLPFGQLIGRSRKEGKVVHISEIRRPQYFGAEMIERIEMNVGEPLAGEIADGQTSPALKRGEQIVSGIVNMDRLLRVRSVNDGVEKPQRPLATDASPQIPFQDGVVNRWKETIEIAPQNMRIAIAEALIDVDGAVSALADAVGIAVVDEAPLE